MKLLKKTGLMLAAVVMVTSAVFALAACGSNSGTYYSYTFSSGHGKFIKTEARYELGGSTYKKIGVDSYGQADFGEYSKSGDRLSFYRGTDSGTTNGATSGVITESMITYKNYLISESAITYARTDDDYLSKDVKNLEGIYDSSANNVLLKDGKVFISTNTSDQIDSFTHEIATYKRTGDFLVMESNSSLGKSVYLIAEMKNEYGNKNVVLASFGAGDKIFASSTPSLTLENTSYALEKSIFQKASSNKYTLSTISWPKKTAVSGVEYSSTNSEVTFDGDKLVYSGTATYVTITITYQERSTTATVYFVDFKVTEGLTTEEKSIVVTSDSGADAAFSTLVAAFIDGTGSYPSYDTVAVTSGSSYAQVKYVSGTFNINFNKVTADKNVTLEFTRTYYRSLLDGTTQTFELSCSLVITILAA